MGTSARSSAESGLFRGELQHLLDSPEFAGSRQLREFLAFTSEQAFRGRTRLDQSEIAAQVLGRREGFNPQDDATVRKLATITRHKLEQHYAREGAASRVRVVLPRRSYVPQYQLRENTEAVGSRGVRQLQLWGVFAAGLVAGMLGLWLLAWPAQTPPAGITIQTKKGDVSGKGMDLPGDCIRLGPRLEESDQAVVRMRFTPEQDAHQAGLLIWEDVDNFVRLGRRFSSRVHLEFGHEARGSYSRPNENFPYDPTGQNGKPIWLAIRRQGRFFSAFASPDGETWRQVGTTLEHADPMPHARVGVYAYNGRREIASTVAQFDRFSVGPDFHDLAENLDPTTMRPWKLESDCAPLPSMKLERSLLTFSAITSEMPCQADWTKPVPPGDWVLTTKVDYVPNVGGAAGLVVRGDGGSVRLFRGDAVSFVHAGRIHLNAPDFSGYPPLILRLRSLDGMLTGSYGRDDESFEEFRLRVPLKELQGNLRMGLRLAKRDGAGTAPLPPAGFYYVHEEITTAGNFR